MADFEEEGAANLASEKEFHDDYISENQRIDAGHQKDLIDHDNQFDPLSYSGMAQNDPNVHHQYQEDEMEGHGDAIAGGYYYSDRADDLPANFAKAQQQPHVYGDEASEEYQGVEDEVRGHHADVSNPFMDVGEQDNGVSSGGYVDDRPIMGGYNPFLNQEERCRADGDEIKEDLYDQGKDHYQQEDADHSYGDHDHDTYQRGHNEEIDDHYHKGQEEEQYDDQYHRGAEEEQGIDQYHTGLVEREDHQYHKGVEEEPADDQYQTGDIEQADHQYHRGLEDDEEQTGDHYHGAQEEQEDGHYIRGDEEQDYTSGEHEYRQDVQLEKEGKQEDEDYEEESEKEVVPDYKQLQEDQDDADLEMDPVENVRDVDDFGSKVKFEAVGCKLYGDGPAQEEKQDDESGVHEELLTEEDNVVVSEPPKAIKCAIFGEANPEEGGHDAYEEERTPGEHVASDDVEERKQYTYDEEEKVQDDDQYDDEQEEKEDDERELDSVGQSKQTDEDLGIVNQAFSDDVDVEDKKIEEEVRQEKESSEEFAATARDDEYAGTEAVEEDSALISKATNALEECIPRNVELDDASKVYDVEDEINKDYSKENYSDEDNVANDDKIVTCPKGFTSEFENTDAYSCHQDRSYADNLLELTSPDTVPQPLPSPPEPKDMSPFDTNAPSDSPSPCHENLGQHGDTSVDENNTGEYLAGEVEGETKFGVDGTAITSTNTRNGSYIHSEDEEEENEEESQQLDPGCVTATETETSVDERSGEYVGQAMEANDNALMSMSMEGSFYDDGGELIGGEDRRGQENHVYNEMDNYEQQSIELSQQIQNCFSQPSQNAFGLQDDYSQSAAVNGGVDSLLDAPVTAPGLQTPVTEHDSAVDSSVTEHDSAVDSSVDVTETQEQEEFQTIDYGSHLVEDSEEPETIGESSIDAVGISSPPEEQTIDQKDLEEALGSIQVSEPAPEKAEEPSSSVDEIPPGPKSEDALAAAAAPAAVAGVAAAAAAAAVSTSKTTTVKKSTTAKAGVKTSTTTTTKAVKETKTTNGKPASAKKTEITTTTITKTTSKKPTDSRPTSAVTTDKKPSAKPTSTSPTKTASPAAPKPSGILPSYAQPIAHRKPREAKPASPEEKKAHTPRTPSATARTPKPQSATTTTATSATTTTITKTTARTTSAAAPSTITNRTAQLARPKSSPTKLTNGTTGSHSTTDNNKSPTKKPESKPASGTVKTVTDKKEIKVTSRIDSGTKSTTTTPKSPTKPTTPRTPSATTTPKTGEVKEVKSKIGSLEKASHTPGGGNVKITTKKTDFTNVTSKIGSKDKMDHKPGGGNVKIETKKLKIEAKSKIGSLDNATHKPAGGDKKIEIKKLEWKVESKIGSLENAKHVPGGGDKKVESKKVEWSAKSKVGSLDNATHVPGGGDKKILSEKLEWKAGSRVGSLDNAKHEPGGGNVKIESRKLDFKEKASPKIGSLDSKKEAEVPATNGVASEN